VSDAVFPTTSAGWTTSRFYFLRGRAVMTYHVTGSIHVMKLKNHTAYLLSLQANGY
jgi:hypothetical protein